MIRKEFDTKVEADVYLVEQKVRQENGYLTKSEREELKQLLEHPDVLIKKGIDTSNIKSIITNLAELQKPCLPVEKDEDISQILTDLKDTLQRVGGLGLTANQIGVPKKISYIKIPKSINKQTKQIEYDEFYLINAEIIEKQKKIIVNDEGCLSFPGIRVTTDRYVFITAKFENEKRQIQTGLFQDLQGLVVQHEFDHQSGTVILDRKHKRK